MVATFGAYAAYYDLLYQDKDNAAEVDYIENLIRRYHPAANSILDLGCGTGRHAKLLAKKGYAVVGVDQSEEMLDLARQDADSACLRFCCGDVADFHGNTDFDVVTALFHVLDYQTSQQALTNTLDNVARQLLPGGLFIFDCWYGPAVLRQFPAVRTKRMESDRLAVTRIAEPVMDPRKNIVEVHYQIFARDKITEQLTVFNEKHVLRYLFEPEITELLNTRGFQILDSHEFQTGREPGFDTWSVCFVAEKRAVG